MLQSLYVKPFTYLQKKQNKTEIWLYEPLFKNTDTSSDPIL